MASYPTMYRGVEFRSRLEAKWACMFDQLQWRWNYEPFDLPGWIPDFQLEGRLLVEVKPFTFEEQWPVTVREIEQAMRAVRLCGSVLLLGAEILPAPNDGNDNLQMGWIYRREQIEGHPDCEYMDRARLYEAGGRFDVSEDTMAWGSNLGILPSGYRKWYHHPPSPEDIAGRWALAANATKWRAP